MAIFPSQKKKAPKMAHHDLSHYFRTSMAPGLLYPIACFPVVAGDDIRISYESLVNTQALLSPLYGSYKLQIDSFVAYNSLYIPKLWRNGFMTRDGRSPLKASYPWFRLDPNSQPSEGSLLSYLGFSPDQVTEKFPYTDQENQDEWNAIPFLMYIDIWRNYYANRQERFFPIWYKDSSDTSSVLKYYQQDLASVDDVFSNLPTDGGSILNSPMNGSAISFLARLLGKSGFIQNDRKGWPFMGLLPRCYMPDKMNVILNSEFLNNNVSSVTVSTSGGSFQVDQLVTAKKLWQSRNHDALTNHSYKDWIRMHYGVTPAIQDDMPTFLGSSSSELVFEDIRATVSDPSIGQYLGDKGSSGKGYLNSRVHRCVCDRNGYFMALASLVPRVDYYQGSERYIRHLSTDDEFKPEFNGVGYQDVLVSDLNSSWTGNYTGTATKDLYRTSVGKQPAWIEYMTAVNKIRGSFCTTEKSWVLARDMSRGPLADGIVSPVEPGENVDVSAYIRPDAWNQPFAIQAPNAQNFLAQFFIKFPKRSEVLKRLMPFF